MVKVEINVEPDTRAIESIIADKFAAALEAGRPAITYRVVQRWWVEPAMRLISLILRAVGRWGYTIR